MGYTNSFVTIKSSLKVSLTNEEIMDFIGAYQYEGRVGYAAETKGRQSVEAELKRLSEAALSGVLHVARSGEDFGDVTHYVVSKSGLKVQDYKIVLKGGELVLKKV